MKKIAIVGCGMIGRTSLTHKMTATDEITVIEQPQETYTITALPELDPLPSEIKDGKQLRRERRKKNRKRY